MGAEQSRNLLFAEGSQQTPPWLQLLLSLGTWEDRVAIVSVCRKTHRLSFDDMFYRFLSSLLRKVRNCAAIMDETSWIYVISGEGRKSGE